MGRSWLEGPHCSWQFDSIKSLQWSSLLLFLWQFFVANGDFNQTPPSFHLPTGLMAHLEWRCSESQARDSRVPWCPRMSGEGYTCQPLELSGDVLWCWGPWGPELWSQADWAVPTGPTTCCTQDLHKSFNPSARSAFSHLENEKSNMHHPELLRDSLKSQVYSKISIMFFLSLSKVNVLSVITLLEANKRHPICIMVLRLLYYIMEAEEIGVTGKGHQARKT